MNMGRGHGASMTSDLIKVLPLALAPTHALTRGDIIVLMLIRETMLELGLQECTHSLEKKKLKR